VLAKDAASTTTSFAEGVKMPFLRWLKEVFCKWLDAPVG